MPEGDTIHRAAASLRAGLDGEPIVSFEARRLRGGSIADRAAPPVAGERVRRVGARGKHLLIGFEGGTTLHTHLRMQGSWHLYRAGERWRRAPGSVVARVAVPDVEAICFSAPVVELLTDAELDRHPTLSALGPDLCEADPDLDEVLRRLEGLDPGLEVGDALLDQTVAGGIGNVYRAEVAWACEIDPRRALGTVEPALRRMLWSTASRLLRSNLGTLRRATVPNGLAVYDRAGRPCPRCAASIVTRRTGAHARSVWWCPGCQR